MTLVWLILIPLIGGLLSWRSDRSVAWRAALDCAGDDADRAGAVAVAVGDERLLVHRRGFLAGAGAPQWTIEYRAAWIPAFGASFHLGLDGLSMLMIVLTNLLGVMAVLTSWRDIDRDAGFFHLNLLWNLGGVVGVFLALDLLLFFFLWEVMLVPMYLLIALWGHDAPAAKRGCTRATKFFVLHAGLGAADAGVDPRRSPSCTTTQPASSRSTTTTCSVRRWPRRSSGC